MDVFETEIGTQVSEAALWLMQQQLVAIPTETVYGLAGNALSPEAVLRIFEAKMRPRFNPLIMHLPDRAALNQYVTELPNTARRLMDAFCPGPLTFLLPKSGLVPDLVTSGSPKVAVRFPAHPLTRALLRQVPFPLAAPSANLFGYVSPVTAQHVYEGLKGRIPYILDGGPCSIGVESTIVDFEGAEVIIRRHGGVSVEAIEAVLGQPVQVRTHATDHPVAPGQLKSHYATHTPLYLGAIQDLPLPYQQQKIALLEFGKPWQTAFQVYARFNLSPAGNLHEAARNLFASMRAADHCGADVILAHPLPAQGLGLAINDRLRRAAYRE